MLEQCNINNYVYYNKKGGILIIAMTLVCGTVNAQHWHRHHHLHQVVTVVVQPDMTSHVSNRFNQKERLEKAVAYLETHKYLTISQYAKMNQLNKISAEAELDAFAIDKKKPIQCVIRGKKKVYKKRIHETGL